MKSKEYSWAWVTADRLLAHGRCELLYVYLVPSGATTNSHLYDGESTAGDKLVTLVSAAANPRPFSPKVPIYCRRGLYVDVGTNVTGIFVQWRELGYKGGES